MKYIKLRLLSGDRDLMYERDFAVEALRPFAVHAVCELIERGTISDGEICIPDLIPRYGSNIQREPVLREGANLFPESMEWPGLRLEEPPRADQPFNTFTLELNLLERNLICRSDLSASDLIPFLVGPVLESTLVSLGLLHQGELYHAELFARDDDQADLSRERLPALERRSSELVEIISEPEPPARRLPPVFPGAELIGRIKDDDVRVYISRNELARLYLEGRRSEKVERGGVLVGEMYQEDGGRYVVDVSGSVIHEDETASAVAFRYTARSWRDGNEEMRRRFPGKRIVGWYHTHLVEVVVPLAANLVGLTAMFFSDDDIFLHRHFFADPWYIALVLDPWGNCRFFQWKKGEVVACDGYYVYDGEQE